MAEGRARLMPAKAAARSRVSNGADVLPNVDGRSLIARRYRDIAAQMRHQVADAGRAELLRADSERFKREPRGFDGAVGDNHRTPGGAIGSAGAPLRNATVPMIAAIFARGGAGSACSSTSTRRCSWRWGF